VASGARIYPPAPARWRPFRTPM